MALSPVGSVRASRSLPTASGAFATRGRTPWAQVKFPASFNPDAMHRVTVSVMFGVLTGTVDGTVVMTTILPTLPETVNGVTLTPNTGSRYGLRTWSPTITDITMQSY